MAAAPWVVSDELWERIEPLLPRVERRFRYPDYGNRNESRVEGGSLRPLVGAV